MRDEPYAIVFSGGGALGAWEVGCYKTIRSRHQDRPPSVVTGASAGALNAAGVCAGMSSPELRRIWAELAPEDVCRFKYRWTTMFGIALQALALGSFSRSLLRFLQREDSLFDTEALNGTLRRIFLPANQSFFQSSIAFAASLTDLASSSRQLYYKLPPGQALPDDASRTGVWRPIHSLEMLIQALMGTTALPVLFPSFEGRFDGGVLLNQPITPALTLGAHNLYVLIPTAAHLGRTNHLLAISSTLISTWLAVSLTAQIESIRLRNQIRVLTGDPKLRVCVIRPASDLTSRLGIGLLSFGSRVDEVADLGEKEASERLDRFDPMDEATWY